MNQSRFVVGVLLVLVAALLFVLGRGSWSTAGVIGLGVLGLIAIAISRRGRQGG
jgi:O-antigen ligase